MLFSAIGYGSIAFIHFPASKNPVVPFNLYHKGKLAKLYQPGHHWKKHRQATLNLRAEKSSRDIEARAFSVIRDNGIEEEKQPMLQADGTR